MAEGACRRSIIRVDRDPDAAGAFAKTRPFKTKFEPCKSHRHRRTKNTKHSNFPVLPFHDFLAEGSHGVKFGGSLISVPRALRSQEGKNNPPKSESQTADRSSASGALQLLLMGTDKA